MIDPTWFQLFGTSGGVSFAIYLAYRTTLYFRDRERARKHRIEENTRDFEALLKLAETKGADEAKKMAEAIRGLRALDQPVQSEKPAVDAKPEQLAIEAPTPVRAIESAKPDPPPGDEPNKAA